MATKKITLKELKTLVKQIIKEDINQQKTNQKGRNIKTVKITVPNEIALKKATTIPTFKNLTRLKLNVGENIEKVNHYQYSAMMRMYPMIGITVEEMV